MKLLHKIAYKLRKLPKLKKFIKNCYQYVGNILSDKNTLPANIKQISSSEKEHLFGYYDKIPWNRDEDKMIYLEVSRASKYASSNIEAKIILKDMILDTEIEIATTKAWNVQQGCMLQWLGPDFNTKILYNDFIDNELKTVIIDIFTKEKRIIDSPVYAVDQSGKFGISLDFYRLNRLRPGYGYNNKTDITENKRLPEGYCIWKVNLDNNECNGIILYKQLYEMDFSDSMQDAEHKVNHIMINPSGNRFMFLHRWIKNGVKSTRLLTADITGNNIYNLLDEDMISHCTWKNDVEILGWARKNDLGNHYYLMKDKSEEIKVIGNEKLITDGHPSYSLDKSFFVTDTYPDFKRKQHIYLYSEEKEELIDIATVYANIKYINDCRCDLHPRLSYSGTKICFDGAQGKNRQVYVIDIGGE